jgi:3-methyladenine DNA glycosylase AlkD
MNHPEPGAYIEALIAGMQRMGDLARAAGVAVHADQTAGVPIIYAWRTRPVLWTRRASLLCHFPAIRDRTVPVGILLDTCEALLDEDEFFIRKAVGWTLREFSKGYPEKAFAFLMQHRERASGLTLKEGMRHLPESWQAQIRG